MRPCFNLRIYGSRQEYFYPGSQNIRHTNWRVCALDTCARNLDANWPVGRGLSEMASTCIACGTQTREGKRDISDPIDLSVCAV